MHCPSWNNIRALQFFFKLLQLNWKFYIRQSGYEEPYVQRPTCYVGTCQRLKLNQISWTLRNNYVTYSVGGEPHDHLTNPNVRKTKKITIFLILLYLTWNFEDALTIVDILIICHYKTSLKFEFLRTSLEKVTNFDSFTITIYHLKKLNSHLNVRNFTSHHWFFTFKAHNQKLIPLKEHFIICSTSKLSKTTVKSSVRYTSETSILIMLRSIILSNPGNIINLYKLSALLKMETV